MRISLDALIFSNCVKYDKLSELIQFAFSGSSATELDIYVDMYSVIKSLYSKNHVTDISDYNSLAAGFINLCAHYRDFFRKNLGVKTNFFLVASYNCCDMNKLLVPNYNKTIDIARKSNQNITQFIDYNLDLLNTLCPYLPDIYFIKSEYEAAVVMYNIMNKRYESGDKNPNLIISKDPYVYQLLSYNLDTAYLRPRKYYGEDTSTIVGAISTNAPTMIELLWEQFSSMHNWKYDGIGDMIPMYMSNVLAFTSVAERNIRSILNVKTIKGIIRNSNIPGIQTVQTIFENNSNLPSLRSCSLELLVNRYKAIDLNFQNEIFKDTVESKLIRFDNLYDPKNVQHINSKYFNDNLDLERL